MPDLGAGPWTLICCIALAASLGTLHIICKRLATDWEIARMVREARALRKEQERRLSEMRDGGRRRKGDNADSAIVNEAPIMEVGAPQDAEPDVLVVGEAPPVAQAA
jgi:hypothetical protein